MRNKFLLATLCLPLWLSAQVSVPFKDMSFWKSSRESNWQIAGDAVADMDKNDALTASAGTGVLVNLPDKANRSNLVSANEYGDVDVSFDFMMAKHSNSGFTSWGVTKFNCSIVGASKILNTAIAAASTNAADLMPKAPKYCGKGIRRGKMLAWHRDCGNRCRFRFKRLDLMPTARKR